ncbi:O-methyltransferase-domain-containing protein [Immersiella caudata]|uniref:O-methyltransferase-domain-containing protein n=1 Tax=Immersiella caudata TaxID=314043 RepID=A0AA39WL90_9PEZI|nr:O-methyltransferase-domain-containing protein [Immersiella caudata]
MSRLNQTLLGLEASLRAFECLLTDPATKQELFRSLHDSTPGSLPDAHVAAAAGRIVDLLCSVEHLLEPAPLKLSDHFLGYTTTKCLVAAVQLNIADHLGKGPLKLANLAEVAVAKPNRLRQILRPLYSNNIFAYDEQTDQLANNHVSELLRSDHWTQWRNWVELYGTEFYDMAAGIPTAVKADGQTRSASQVIFDTDEDMFTYFQRRGWVPRLHRTLAGGAEAMAPGILADYPWYEIAHTTVLDIGGGSGALMASLLRHHPTMRGAILDLPAVIEHIRPSFEPGGRFSDVGPRVVEGLMAGDFLAELPSFSAYTIKWVLHDWDDADAVKILRNVRAAIKEEPSSRLLILESILSDRRSGRLSVYGDINMMMTANGRERTEAQWRTLAADGGWVIHKIHPLRNAWVQAIDLRPAPAPGSNGAVPSDDITTKHEERSITNGVTNSGHASAAMKPPSLGAVVKGDVAADGQRVVMYIIKADQTSYINYIKPLILAVELEIPHVLSVIDTKDEWYFKIHPQRMVPALKDRDPTTGEDAIVFESTACLQYLCERFDRNGAWVGRTAAEKSSVLAWTAYQTAALGPTAKYWLYFLRGYPNRQNPVPLPRTIEQLHKDTLRQWDILEKRLAEPGQVYIALKDRPTIADLSYLPFSMPYMFSLFSVSIEDWPRIHEWSRAMLSRAAVKAVLDRAPTLGHD